MWRRLAFATCLAFGAPSPARAIGLVPEGTDASVSLQALRYDVEVDGMYAAATMEVTLVASSDGGSANLRFPLPPGAVIHRAEVYLGDQGRWAVAETIGRRRAGAVYEDTSSAEHPLLVQQVGRDLYRARVSPIRRTPQRFRIAYAHPLLGAAEERTLRIAFRDPLTETAVPAEGVEIHVHTATTSEAGVWQNTAGLRVLEVSNWPSGLSDLTLSTFTTDRDLDLALPGPSTDAVLVYRSRSPGLPDFVHALWTPDLSGHPELASGPRNVVFVLDRSGSMAGRKLAELQRAVTEVLGQLEPEDHFGLVAFDESVMSFRDRLSAAGETSAAAAWIAALTPGGSTALTAGLVRAVELARASEGHCPQGALDLLVATDGLPNTGPSTPEEILGALGAAAEGLGCEVRIFAVGIGYDLSQDLLDVLTTRTGGEVVFALDDAALRGDVLDLFTRVRGGGITRPVVGLDTLDDGRFHPGHLFPGDRLALGGRAPGVQGGLQDLELGLAGLGPRGAELRVGRRLTPPPPRSTGIALVAPALAAKAWAVELERTIDRDGETDDRVRAALTLAMRYGVVTRYSGLLALESEGAYAQNGITRPARDEAGVALEPVQAAGDESRIGGEGLLDEAGSYATASLGDASCTCTRPRPVSPFGLLVMLAGVALLRRRPARAVSA